MGMNTFPDKFACAGLTGLKSSLVKTLRIAECTAQMEAELVGVYEMMQDAEIKGFIALEVKVLRTHVHDNIRMAGHGNRITLISGDPSS
jgi:flavin reductase (DIM6/NTAB) family NADH-FMN oxidoreductase RutF